MVRKYNDGIADPLRAPREGVSVAYHKGIPFSTEDIMGIRLLPLNKKCCGKSRHDPTSQPAWIGG